MRTTYKTTYDFGMDASVKATPYEYVGLGNKKHTRVAFTVTDRSSGDESIFIMTQKDAVDFAKAIIEGVA